MATATLTSASGFMALLDAQEEDALKNYALKELNSVVDQFWPEIAGSVADVYVMTIFLVSRLSSSSSLLTYPFLLNF